MFLKGFNKIQNKGVDSPPEKNIEYVHPKK